MKVDCQMERGIPYCELRGCELTIELGTCPKTGLRKQACCVKHHRQHKLFSKIGNAAEPQPYKHPIGIQPTAFAVGALYEPQAQMHQVWLELHRDKTGATWQPTTSRADFISVFDGPDGDLNGCVRAMGMAPLPPVDVLAATPIDLLDDGAYCAQVLTVLENKPKFMHAAPPCRFWSHTTNFSRGNATAEMWIQEGRATQRRLMRRFVTLVKAAMATGCHIMMKNSLQSRWWKEDFALAIRALEDETGSNPHELQWREFSCDQCRFGSHYKKPTRFWTTAPRAWAQHMEVRCNHDSAHTR
jgi:hypothetical protein